MLKTREPTEVSLKFLQLDSEVRKFQFLYGQNEFNLFFKYIITSQIHPAACYILEMEHNHGKMTTENGDGKNDTRDYWARKKCAKHLR